MPEELNDFLRAVMAENGTTEETPEVVNEVELEAVAETPNDTQAGIKPEEQQGIIPEQVQETKSENQEEGAAETVTTPELTEEEKKPDTSHLDWIRENEDKVFEYLLEKKKDYNSLSAEDVIYESLRKNNPEYDDNDIALLMEQKYGIGEDKIDLSEIDKEAFPKEYAEAVKYNKAIDAKILNLKSDAKKAREELNAYKEKLELPKYEKETQLTVEEYQAEQTRQAQEYVEKEWIPAVNEGLKEFKTIQYKIEVPDGDDRLDIPLSFDLSDKHKQILAERLRNYVGQPGDEQKYLKDGRLDVAKLAEDQSWFLFGKEMAASAVREQVAKKLGTFIKDELKQFDDGEKSKTIPAGEPTYEELVANSFKLINSR